METISQDLRYGLRSLWKSPGFAIVSTLTLALAIGVNTSIFSLVSVIVFADLPMQESETVHLVRGVNAELEIDQGSVSPADYMDLVERSRSFESLSALTEGQWVLTGLDQPVRVTGLQFTVGLTETWKLPPEAQGRAVPTALFEWPQVVGVVSDVRAASDLDQGSPNIYVPHPQDARDSIYLVTHTSADPASLASPIRDAIWRVDANQPIDAIQTMERAQHLAASSSYALLTLFVTFAVFALVMAAIGIYGVMAYSVSQRRQEIGLRMALGAEAGTVRWMVVSQGARLLGVGVAVGLVSAFAISRLLGNLVFGISATDPLTFVGVPLVLAAVAMVANLVPARRATRLDPADTLRATR